MNCAIIIISGEYKRSRKPNIPDAENTRYKIKPTTTGGKLMKEFTMIINSPLPKKFFIAIWPAIIIDTKAAKIVAANETQRDK